MTASPAIPSEVALLRALGPTGDVVVTIDFETYFDTDYKLRKMTTEGYVRDPRFEVLGVGVRFGHLPTVWLEEWDFRLWAARVDWSRVAVLAHHAHFDGLILSHHYGIHPRFFLDTLSMGRALHGSGGVSLKRLGPLYGLGEKGEELRNVLGKRRADLTQAAWMRLGAYCCQDVDLTRGVFDRMPFPALELWSIDTTIRFFTNPRFRADRAVLEKARDDERRKKRDLLRSVANGGTEEDARATLSSNDKFAALLQSLGVESPTKLNKKGTQTWAFAKDDPGMKSLLEHERDEIRHLAEARLAVKSTIIETRAERIIGIAERGPVTFYLKYSGAHTHRWSGGDKMNPQNFNRGGDLRDAILAPMGSILAVADLEQIEARVIAWLARETKLLELFRRNDAAKLLGTREATRLGVSLTDYWKQNGGEPDFYAAVGSMYFLKKVSKKETPIERQLSKNMVLGLGFGMGWAKFAGELLKGMLGSAPVRFTEVEARKFGVDVGAFECRPFGSATCGDAVEDMRTFGVRLSYGDLLTHAAVADHFVRLYRRTNAGIQRLWGVMDRFIQTMATGGGDPNETRLTFGPLKVIHQGIVKPGGLVLRYPGLKRRGREWSYLGGESGREHKKIYGGLLTENVVQSLARDVIAEQALRIRADGYHLATTTHDEVVAITDAADGARCLEAMVARMRVPPSWCPDLPLNASGGIGERYGDAK